jgi:hypothetical protein
LDLAFEVFIFIPNLLYIGCEVFTLWFNIYVHSLFWSNKTLTKKDYIYSEKNTMGPRHFPLLKVENLIISNIKAIKQRKKWKM